MGWLTVPIGTVQRFTLATLLGAFLSFAMPPLYLFPLTVISLTGLLILIHTSKGLRHASAIGWWFGFGHFSTGLYWFAFALLTDPVKYGWMIPFAVFGISGVLACYIMLVALVVKRMDMSPVVCVLFFAMVWTIVEILRATLFSGFPWNLLGYSANFSEYFIQLASIFGVYGISLVVCIAGAIPYSLWKISQNKKGKWQLTSQNKTPTIIVYVLVAVIWMWGGWRSMAHPIFFDSQAKLRVVQAGIEQDHKWDPALREYIMSSYLDLTMSEGYKEITHVLWPETATPYFLNDNEDVRLRIGAAVPRGGYVMTGSLRGDTNEFGALEEVWNSLFVINDQGKIVDYYDKNHLVPFGEYVPFRQFLPIEKITEGQVDFSPGKGFQTLTVPGLPPFSPLICYEAIFSGQVTNKKQDTQLLINITNDAWFGRSAAPYQHLEMSRVRAIEEGLPLIRAANTGISAVIDPMGRVLGKTKLGEKTVLDTMIPLAVHPTFYRKYGMLGLWGVLFLLLWVSCRNKRNKN